MASADGAISMPCCSGVPLAALRVEVARGHARAGLRELRGQHGADLAEPDDAHAPAVEPVRAGGGVEPAPDSLEDRLCGDGGGVASTAVLTRAPHRKASEAGHVVHIRGARADVLGGDVRTVEPLDHAGGALQARRAHLLAAVVDHHGLATAELEAGRGRLQRHRARQAHHVFERLAQAARVALQPHATQCRAQHSRVHRDDEAQPRRRVLADHDLLVIVVSQGDVRSRRGLGSNGHRP